MNTRPPYARLDRSIWLLLLLLVPYTVAQPCATTNVIPSIFPLGATTYTTPAIVIQLDTGGYNPNPSCQTTKFTDYIWYEFTPSITAIYDLIINLTQSDSNIQVYYNGSSCNDAQRLRCVYSVNKMDAVQLYANTKYYIAIQPQELPGQSLQLTVFRRVPPVNNFCINATVINVVGTTNRNATTIFASHDPIADALPCTNRNGETIWYKLTNNRSSPVLMSATINEFQGYGIQRIATYKGSTCGAFACVGAAQAFAGRKVTFDFIVEVQQTYYIMIQVSPARTFTLSFEGKVNYFSIIDSHTDKFLQGLSDIDYSTIKSTSSGLNIRATLRDPSTGIVRSVRMMYDNQTRACDAVLPYSVFGDVNGNYSDTTIKLGTHTVVATPYSTSNCTGPPGTPLVQSFNVAGCALNFEVFSSPFTPPVSNQCKANVLVSVFCGYPNVRTVRLQLRNATTNKVVRERLFNYTIGNGPYALFDVVNDVLTGTLSPGSYVATAFVDNMKHPSRNFTIGNTTCSTMF